MALPQTANVNDITNVIANLAQRQNGKTKEKIAGPKRAAMLMLALGEQYGGKVWSLLDDDEVRELSMVMSTLAPSRPIWSKTCCSNSSRECRLPER